MGSSASPSSSTSSTTFRAAADLDGDSARTVEGHYSSQILDQDDHLKQALGPWRRRRSYSRIWVGDHGVDGDVPAMTKGEARLPSWPASAVATVGRSGLSSGDDERIWPQGRRWQQIWASTPRREDGVDGNGFGLLRCTSPPRQRLLHDSGEVIATTSPEQRRWLRSGSIYGTAQRRQRQHGVNNSSARGDNDSAASTTAAQRAGGYTNGSDDGELDRIWAWWV